MVAIAGQFLQKQTLEMDLEAQEAYQRSTYMQGWAEGEVGL